MASVLVCVVLLQLLSLSNCLPVVLKLERARREKRTANGFVNFPLEGSSVLDKWGYYFTKVKIGSPPREYLLLIDTGTDITWVSCLGCETCPTSNTYGMQLQPYNANSSASASVISCLDKRCPRKPIGFCDSQTLKCNYEIEYEDRSTTAGYYVSDVFHLDTIMNGSTSTYLTSLIFGCSKNRSRIVIPGHTVHGVLGLNAGRFSQNSQLSSPALSHCLSGGEAGGGVLVLGEIQDPRLVYTPLYISGGQYNVNIQSISISGVTVPIDPKVFGKKGRRAVVDSGSTLIELAPDLYNPVINYLTSVVFASAQPVKQNEYHCFSERHRPFRNLPEISFKLEGGASMTIQAKDYLIWLSHYSFGNASDTVCVLFRRGENPDSTTLGEIILQNKIIVYDPAGKRLGWADHDCTKPINASSVVRASSSIKYALLIPRITNILTLFLYLFMLF